MIAYCPCHGRPVANDEWLTRTRAGVWVPTQCAAGDGPLCVSGQELVINRPHWFVSCIDPDSRPLAKALLCGPYPSYTAATDKTQAAMNLAAKRDPWSAFYAYGISSSQLPHKTVFGIV